MSSIHSIGLESVCPLIVIVLFENYFSISDSPGCQRSTSGSNPYVGHSFTFYIVLKADREGVDSWIYTGCSLVSYLLILLRSFTIQITLSTTGGLAGNRSTQSRSGFHKSQSHFAPNSTLLTVVRDQEVHYDIELNLPEKEGKMKRVVEIDPVEQDYPWARSTFFFDIYLENAQGLFHSGLSNCTRAELQATVEGKRW